jgi:hypothetical protein
MTILRGSCLCGEVRFEVTGPFPKLYQCRCSLCRKQGGSVSNTGLIVKADKFRWTGGEEGIGRWQRATGFRSWFCQRCGAVTPNPLRDTDYVWVPAGTLDDDAPLEVIAQLYVGSKQSWDRPPDSPIQHATAPPLAEIIAILHGRPPSA